jgi:hypothetical protein
MVIKVVPAKRPWSAGTTLHVLDGRRHGTGRSPNFCMVGQYHFTVFYERSQKWYWPTTQFQHGRPIPYPCRIKWPQKWYRLTNQSQQGQLAPYPRIHITVTYQTMVTLVVQLITQFQCGRPFPLQYSVDGRRSGTGRPLNFSVVGQDLHFNMVGRYYFNVV